MSQPTFGTLLQRLLNERGLTQASCAEGVGLDETWLSRVVTGARSPSAAHAATLAAFLKLAGARKKDFLDSALIARARRSNIEAREVIDRLLAEIDALKAAKG